MYQQQLAMAQMSNQPPPSAHEFFGGNPHVDPSAFNNGVPRPIDATNQNFAMQQHPQLMGPLGSIPEAHNTATSEDIMRSLESAGCYTLDNIDMSTMAPKQQYMAYDGSQDFMFNQQFNMATNVQDFAQYGDMPNGPEESIEFQYAGAPMQPTQSNGSTPSIPSTMSSMHSGSTMASSVGGMQVPTVSTEWTDDSKPAMFTSGPSDMPQSAYSSPPEDTGMWMQGPPNFEHTLSPEDACRPPSSQAFPPTPPTQSDKQLPFSNPGELEIPPEALSRRPSSTNGLAESMGNVDIQSRSASLDSGFKQPEAPSSLAARRQRPRPAALGQAALRSASYTTGMPISPGTNGNLGPPEQTLHRIRSCGLPGAANGRIQKSGNGSGQRSPMNLTFADAAASPKFARHASYAAVSSPGQTSLAPPTPLTPNDAARFPSWQSHGSIHSHNSHNSIDQSSPNGIAVSWTSESPAIFPTHVSSSPPETPLDKDQAVQYQTYLHNMAMYRDTPPQSAPATQQTFSAAMAPPAIPDTLSVNAAQMAHLRRPSLPENVMVPQPMPLMHAPTGDMPLTYQSMPYQRMQIPQAHVTVPSQTTAAYPTPPHPAPAPIGGANSLLSADFAVHEYTPPAAGGRAKDNASPSQGFMKDSGGPAPKVFQFANHGPKDFQAQQAQLQA